MTLLSHSPFSRTELHRRQIAPGSHDNCAECGLRNARGGLFTYSIQPESLRGRTYPVPGLFCSVGCMRSYHHV